MNGLKVRNKRSAGNTGDFGTNAAQVLGLTARLYLITHRRLALANVTASRHENKLPHRSASPIFARKQDSRRDVTLVIAISYSAMNR